MKGSNHMNTLIRTMAGSAACALVALGLSVAPTDAASPVTPREHDVFVVTPADGGACPFPVQWDITTSSLGLDLPHHFFAMSPGWSVTITNLDTGKTLAPHGDGSVQYAELPDGSIRLTSDGVNYGPVSGHEFVGHLTRIFYTDGSVSDWMGTGRVIDLCALLA
jgi:hypothetical protein